MQTWARRGIQTALVTGGVLMLGTGIAAADEDVNPDKPASPLDLEPRVTFSFDEQALGTTLKDVNDVTQDVGQSATGNVLDDVTDRVPLAQQAVTSVAGTVGDQLSRDPAVPVDVSGRSDEPAGTESESGAFFVEWVAPIRIDGGTVALMEEEADADGVVGENRFGLTADLRSLRELADLGDLPARAHGAGADLLVTGNTLREELIGASGGLVEASQNQYPKPDSGVLSGDLTLVPVDQPAGGEAASTGQRSARNTVDGMSTTSGEWGSMSGIAHRAPLGSNLPVVDVPADLLARALTTHTQRSAVDTGEGSPLALPVLRDEVAPNKLPSLLPLGLPAPANQRSADPVDDVAGILSGVLDNVTNQVTPKPRILPTGDPNLFGPISGNLFDDGVESLPVVGDLVGTLGNVDQATQSTGLTSLLSPAGDRRGARDLPAALPGDLDVTQIVPTIPSLGDLRATQLRGVPALANFPSVDPSTLTDTRAALASLFTNHPIG